MRSANFTAPAPAKEVEKTKIAQLDQDGVNKRVADFVKIEVAHSLFPRAVCWPLPRTNAIGIALLQILRSTPLSGGAST
jgi:hypothetical protein